MHVKINTPALTDAEVTIENAAAELVRMGFNPSARPRVDRIKALGAALVSECERMMIEDPSRAREASTAITQLQGAIMFAVAAETGGVERSG